MDKQLIHTQIATLLEAIIDQEEIMSAHEGGIPQIELDLVLANVRKLYDLYRSLEKSNGSNPPPVKKLIKRAPKLQHSPGLFEDIFSEMAEKTAESKIEETHTLSEKQGISKIPNTEIKASVIEEINAVDSMESPVSSAEIEEPIVETLHDKILQSSENEDILANKLKKQPVEDLRTAIGINEKFLFINEIFNADAAAYSNSIDFINQCKSLTEAKVYVETILKPRFNWTTDNKRVADFLELVERRFL